MIGRKNRQLINSMFFVGLAMSFSANSRADVGPPAKISMTPTLVTAMAGVEFQGEFTINVRRPGKLTVIKIFGDGWNIVKVGVTPGPHQVEVGLFRVPFRAIPTDPDAVLSMTMSFDGQHVTRSLALGPAMAARRLIRTQPLLYTNATIQSSPPSLSAKASEISNDGDYVSVAQGCQTLRFEGRIVYQHPSAIDGSCTTPTSFTLEGVDGIKVEVVDQDAVFDEVIWTGFTRPDGTFDSGMIAWDDCDIGCTVGCDLPDIYLRYECDTAVVNVQDGDDIFESDWTWDHVGEVVDDFGGSYYNFGTKMPSNVSEMPALHMHNSITRSHRFLTSRGIATLPEVDVLWPWGTNAFYDKSEPEINISNSRQWNIGTHIHEYGHHYMENESFSQPPDYCNDFCDGTTACTAGMDCEQVGHCGGCPENPADAWQEGFPSWMADVIVRSWADDYQFSDGTPWVELPACARSQETPQTCCQDDVLRTGSEILITETFVSALLRDIDDGVSIDGTGLQDDHNGDGIFDSMCLGVSEIFSIVSGANPPQSLQGFVNQFYNNYPQHRTSFWKTAVNIDPILVNGLYPADTLPPEAVLILDSSTHPLTVGGTSSCVAIEWEPPVDDVIGACEYSYTWVTDVTQAIPNTTANTVDFSGCLPTAHLEHYGLDEYYFGIRAKDCAGLWGPHRIYGPFEITECNSTGIVDVCDITCDGSELDFSDTCVGGMPANGCNIFGCGTEEDCNGNLVPDGCDIISGFSEDCNIDNIPDECQPFKHWTGDISSEWKTAGNWVEMQIPQFGDHVCIPANALNAPVVYEEDDTLLASLSSRLDFTIAHLTPQITPDLRLVINSFVLGDFRMIGGSTRMVVDDRLYVDGKFTWSMGEITGPGVVEVKGGIDLTQFSGKLIGSELKITGGQSVSDGPRITVSSGAVVTIDTQATYNYTGSSVIVDGGNGLVDVRGTLNSSATDSDVYVQTPVDNSGTIRAQVGDLVLARGGVHTGLLASDIGANLVLSGFGANTTELLASSSVVADKFELASTSGNIRGSVNIVDTLACSGGTWTFHPEANVIDYGRHFIATRAGNTNFLAPTNGPINFDTVDIGPPTQGAISVHFDTGQPFNITDFTLTSSVVDGSSPINIGGSFSWRGNGRFFSGGDITANCPVTIAASNTDKILNRTFHNKQTTTMFGGGLGLGGPSSVRWHNLPGSLFDIQANTVRITGRTFHNESTLLRSSGTGNAFIGSAFDNSGLIHNQTGMMDLRGGGVHSGELRSDAGTLLSIWGTTEFLPGSSLVADDIELSSSNCMVRGNVNISGVMTVKSGPWTFTNEANIISYGTDLVVNTGKVTFEAPTDAPIVFDTITFNGGTAEFNTGQPVNVTTLTSLNGTITGASPINVANMFVWTRGNFFAGGDVTLNGTSVVNVTSSARTMNRQVFNAGDFTLLGRFSLSSGRRITNLASGVFDMPGDDTRISGGSFLNEGLFLKSAGNVSSDFLFHDFVNAGTVDIQTNRLVMQISSYTQTAGETILSGGDFLMVSSNDPMTIDGGILMGIGMIDADVDNNGGTTAPGLSAGELTIDGDYTQGATASLEIEIGGANTGEFDVLTVTGAVTLAGELRITDLAGFTPQAGNTFVIMTAASIAGTFDVENIPNHYIVIYNATNVTIQGVAPSPDLNGDGVVDLKDFALFQSCYNGAGQPPSASCTAGVNADLDMDSDVDLDDYMILFAAITP